MRQGHPFVLHLSLVVGEDLNIMVKQQKNYGITILGSKREQTFSQYAYDTSLTLVGDENNIDKVVDLLKKFFLISKLKFNWAKPMT